MVGGARRGQALCGMAGQRGGTLVSIGSREEEGSWGSPDLKLDMLLWDGFREEGGADGRLLQQAGGGGRAPWAGAQRAPACGRPPRASRWRWHCPLSCCRRRPAARQGPLPATPALAWFSKYWPRTNRCTKLVFPLPISPNSTSLLCTSCSTIIAARSGRLITPTVQQEDNAGGVSSCLVWGAWRLAGSGARRTATSLHGNAAGGGVRCLFRLD